MQPSLQFAHWAVSLQPGLDLQERDLGGYQLNREGSMYDLWLNIAGQTQKIALRRCSGTAQPRQGTIHSICLKPSLQEVSEACRSIYEAAFSHS